MKIGLITGGRWHNEPYLFLKRNNIEVVLFDDSSKCFLKKKYNLNNYKLKYIRSFKNIPLWSPCNDLGSVLSDYYNKSNSINVSTRTISSFNKTFDKKKFSNLSKKKIIYKKNKYLLKLRSGSGSKGIKFWNGQKYDKKKYYLEKFIKGFELSVEVISINGEHKIFAISYRILKKTKSAIAILSLNFPRKFRLYIQKIVEKHLIENNVENGVSHIELIINKNFITIIDTNLRCPGAVLTDYLYLKLTNKNLYEIDYNILINKKKKLNFKKNNQNGIILFENIYLRNFKKGLKQIFNNSDYISIDEIKLNKKYDEVDSNRKGLGVKKFKSLKEVSIFCKKILKEKDYLKFLEFTKFYKKF